MKYYLDSVPVKEWPEPWRLLDVKEAAKRTGFSVPAFRQRSKKEGFPPSVALGKAGRLLRWLDRDIELWISQK